MRIKYIQVWPINEYMNNDFFVRVGLTNTIALLMEYYLCVSRKPLRTDLIFCTVSLVHTSTRTIQIRQVIRKSNIRSYATFYLGQDVASYLDKIIWVNELMIFPK